MLTPLRHKHKTILNNWTAELCWARQIIGDYIYEVSVYYPEQTGYHTWYVVIMDGVFTWLEIAQYGTTLTSAIRDYIWEESELLRLAEGR